MRRIALTVLGLFLVSLGYSQDTNRTEPGSGNEVIVLCYHTFIGKEGVNTDFTPSAFSNQIEVMKGLGYRFVSFDDIAAGNVSGTSNILITIDDGNRTVKKIYDSVLMPSGIKPILFIYPAIIGRVRYALKYKDLTKFESEGAKIAGHGYYHLFINQKLFNSDEASFDKEIFKSRSTLEENLKTNISVFAYPFGSFSEITEETLKKAGFQYAFSLRHGYLEVPLSRNNDPYNLPRYMVTKTSWNSIENMLRNNQKVQRHARSTNNNENG